MKKPATVLIILISAVAGVVLGNLFLGNINTSPTIPVLEEPTPTPTPSPEPGMPVVLSVPKLNINASIESVGLDSENRMDVPKNAMNVAWYNLGSKPGAFGNAVLAGHLDKADGRPAIFHNIATLTVGDELSVLDKKQKSYTYEVTKIATYPHDQVPLQEIFGETDGTYLNLITCEGAFDNQTKNYSHRTVIYSTLVQ